MCRKIAEKVSLDMGKQSYLTNYLHVEYYFQNSYLFSGASNRGALVFEAVHIM
jgi:hypothetical protein